ncbi:MAG: GNAT family N-acetyltransferase [Clostridia bacterium]|nr:GNAT family N-acetyltransferase [Clostridia bacterium]
MNAPIDISSVVLKTPRLILRPWRESDLEDFYSYASVEGVGEWAGWKPHKDIEESRQRLERFIRGKKTFAIDLSGRAVGSLGVEEYDRLQFPAFDSDLCRSLGFVLARDQWGQGLMTEAVTEAVRWLFEEVGLDALFCSHYLFNHRSARVQTKCGFRHILYSIHKDAFGNPVESETNVITRSDYFGRIKPKNK